MVSDRSAGLVKGWGHRQYIRDCYFPGIADYLHQTLFPGATIHAESHYWSSRCDTDSSSDFLNARMPCAFTLPCLLCCPLTVRLTRPARGRVSASSGQTRICSASMAEAVQELAPRPRLRLLCLHSFRTSAAIFKEQVQAHVVMSCLHPDCERPGFHVRRRVCRWTVTIWFH